MSGSSRRTKSKGKTGPWQKSATPNLYRFRPSGTYFARARVGGKLIRQSLDTSTYSVAVLRLNDLLKEHRARAGVTEAAADGLMTFRQAAETMMQQVDANPSVKSSTRVCRKRCLSALLRSWPGLAESDARRITARQCEEWAARVATSYSPTMYNNTVGTLRARLSAPWKGAELQWGSNPTRQLSFQPVAAEGGVEVMKRLEHLGDKGPLCGSASEQAAMQMNTEKVPKPSDVDADPAQTWGRLSLDMKRTKQAMSRSTGALVAACWQRSSVATREIPPGVRRRTTCRPRGQGKAGGEVGGVRSTVEAG